MFRIRYLLIVLLSGLINYQLVAQGVASLEGVGRDGTRGVEKIGVQDAVSNFDLKDLEFSDHRLPDLNQPNPFEGAFNVPLFQDLTISGVVTSESGDPLPGVNVVIQGTQEGTVTDVNGAYSLQVPEEATLVFSFVGYARQQINVNGRSSIDVTMSEDISQLDEIVVVGYGTQTKKDLTGSISSVKAEDLETVPTPTIAESMAGRTSGVFVKTKSAQPGDYSGVSYNIRGFGEPLIIIDGMPASNEEFLLLNPSDIEELNILKDAGAAAEYGARAGNGVILVTTKRGIEQEAQFSYSANYGLQKLTMLPNAVNSWQNAQYENVTRQNAGLDPKWTMEDINKFKSGDYTEWNGTDDPDYPNTDWWDLTLRPLAPQTKHNLSVRGGTEDVKYFVSGGYYYQESLYRSNDLKNNKYNLRSNLDIALTDNLDLGLDLSFLKNDFIGPSWDMASGNGHLGVMMLLYRSRPQYPATYPDPTKLPAMGNDDLNPVSATKINDVGYKKWNNFMGDTKFTLDYKLPYGLNAKAKFNYNRTFRRDKRKEKLGKVYWYDYDAEGNIQYHNHRSFNSYNWLHEEVTESQELIQQYFLTWDKAFGNHNFNALAIYEHIAAEGNWFDARRIRYEYDMDYLFAGPDKDKSNNGRGWQSGRIGQIFSLDYNYNEKYLLGFNVRRDGSPKFPPDTRWGVFPSISAGWNISDENFMQSGLPFVSNLKLRASYGKLGYDETGDYQYLSTYSIRPQALMVDGEVKSGISRDNIPNYSITWEKMITSNLGLDFGLLNDQITGAVDVFHRQRTDVLGPRQVSIPNFVGANLAEENIEEYSDRGIEFSLDYRKTIGDLRFQIGGNMSYSRERVEYIDQPEYASEEEKRRNNQIGRWSDTQWGYRSDGIFTSQEEIDNWAIIDGRQNATVNVGDIKILDYNGDGVINSNDQVVIGRGNSPDIMFAGHGRVSWKGFDFSMLWQGAGLYDLHYGASADLRIPFAGGNAPILEKYNNAYIPENEWGLPANTSQYPLFPREYWPGYSTHNLNPNIRFWYRNGTYVRLKNIELGYNLPENIINRVGLGNLKVYVSGYNLLTFSALDFYDPELERVDNPGAWNYVLEYPPTGMYNFGLILDF